MAEYVIKTMRKLPNFSAMRSATGFELATPDELAGDQFHAQSLLNKSVDNSNRPHQDLGPAGAIPTSHLYVDQTTEHTVAYRDGKEVEDAPDLTPGRPQAPRLVSQGEFGLILSTVMQDTSHGKIAWSRWEHRSTMKLAVFYFEVPREASHYVVGSALSGDEELPAYHGEIAIDPAVGTVYRISIQAWLREPAGLEGAAIAVEYDSVTIGNKAYICPVHGVAQWSLYPAFVDEDADPPPIPRFKVLNDVRFTQYHVFRSDSRILPGTGPGI